MSAACAIEPTPTKHTCMPGKGVYDAQGRRCEACLSYYEKHRPLPLTGGLGEPLDGRTHTVCCGVEGPREHSI